MKISLFASMIASSPVRTHLGALNVSQTPRNNCRVTHPSMKVSFVLETSGSLSRCGNIVGDTHACGLLIYPSAFDGL